MKKLTCIFCVALVLLLIKPIVTFAQKEEHNLWTYENSILLTLQTQESTFITTTDLTGIDCRELYVLEKTTMDDGILWEVVAVLGSENAEDAIEVVRELPFVKNAVCNDEYALQDSILCLSSKVLYIPIGKSANVGIDYVELHPNTPYDVFGVEFKINPEKFDETKLTPNIFLQYGITHFWPKEAGTMVRFDQSEKPELLGTPSPSHTYFGYCNLGMESLLQTVKAMSCLEEVAALSIVRERAPTGDRFYEHWNIEDSSIVKISLWGGEKADDSKTLLNQAAVITSKKEGKTVLSVERGGWGSHVITQCEIMVYNPNKDNAFGDVNEDNKTDAKDALAVLKHSVGKEHLPQEKISIADMNKDQEINAMDALQMLKISVGK